MKKEFTILKHKPAIEIRVTRDSVCMADDCFAPHESYITQPSFVNPEAFIKNLYPGYLPSISGVGHTWECFLNETLIGIILVNKVVLKVSEIEYEKENHVYFKYNSATY
ncbi:hypothetical protein EYD45_06430 [Hyunsoonleella flava]|uniref:Uncharacterized protein n=1 Tax=Hyunsoonleella flava TaxID=2527939 RepID=A0A4V2JAA2_9FLAO|nr:hypothetical protein [Hyunsoonleella flava]TBN04894.1 hypothetical protein EYD45_06430 [Hyunsoonleella flava]